MADPTPFEKRFATRLVQMGVLSREDVIALYRRRKSSSGAGRAFDEWLVEIAAIPAEVRQRALADLDQARTLVDAPPLPARIGGYRVVGAIGAGGMGQLYKVHDEALDKFFAAKVLAAERAGDSHFMMRLREEAKLASRIDSPHVVSVLRFDSDGDRHYLLMPFVDGRNLAEHVVAAGGPLPPGEAIGLVRQAALGLAAIHAIGVLHRDVKPHNLLVNRDGRVLVTDFGLARDQRSDAHLTATGQIVGTPQYMSPEQIVGEDLDARTDVYSLGLTLYYLLTAEAAFDGPTAIVVLDRQRVEPLPDPSRRNPAARGEIVHLLARMTAKDRELRPASMEEVVAELDRVVAGGRARRLPGAGRRAAVRAAAAALAVLVLAGIGLALRAALGGDEATEEPPISAEAPAPVEVPAEGPEEARRRAIAFEEENPGDLPRIVGRYREVAERFPDTAAGHACSERAHRILDDRARELEAELLALAGGDRPEAAVAAAWDAAREFDHPHWRAVNEALRGRTWEAIWGALHRLVETDRPSELVAAAERAGRLRELGPPRVAAEEASRLASFAAEQTRSVDRRREEFRRWVRGLEATAASDEGPILADALDGIQAVLAQDPWFLHEPGSPLTRDGLLARRAQVLGRLDAARAEFARGLLDELSLGHEDEVRNRAREASGWCPLESLVDGLAGRLTLVRVGAWRFLLAGDPAAAETTWERSARRLRLGALPYPNDADVAPIAAVRHAFETAAERLREACRAERPLWFRLAGEPDREKRLIVDVPAAEGPPGRWTFGWRKFGVSSRGEVQLRDLHPDDLAALAFGLDLDGKAPPRIPGAIADRHGLASLLLALGDPDRAEAIARESLFDERQRAGFAVQVATVRRLLAARPGGPDEEPPPEEPPPDDGPRLDANLRTVFGARAQWKRSRDRLVVEASYDFDDAADLERFHLAEKGYRLEIERGALVLSPPGAPKDPAVLLLPAVWDSRVELEIDFRWEDEDPLMFGLLHHVEFERKAGYFSGIVLERIGPGLGYGVLESLETLDAVYGEGYTRRLQGQGRSVPRFQPFELRRGTTYRLRVASESPAQRSSLQPIGAASSRVLQLEASDAGSRTGLIGVLCLSGGAVRIERLRVEGQLSPEWVETISR